MRAPRTVLRAGSTLLTFCGLVALLQLHRTGLGLSTLTVGFLGLAGFRHSAHRFRLWRVVSAPTASEVARRTRPDLVSAVEEISERLAVRTPRVVLLESDEPFAEVHQKGQTPVVILDRSLSVTLDSSALAGILAHELAHVDGDSFYRQRVLGSVVPLVGFASFWSVFLAAHGPELRIAGTVVFWGLWVLNAFWPAELLRLGMGLGVELALLPVLAAVFRAEEYLVDERAASAMPDVSAYFESLAAMDAVTGGAGSSELSAERSPFDALLATHPPIERRASRLGVSTDDIGIGRTERPTEG